MPASRARSRTGKYVHVGRVCRTTRKMTITIDWKKKNTQAEPTAARARISRGNETFFTMPALLTTTPVPVSTPSEKRFQSSSPAKRKITKSGCLLPSTIWKTTK